MTAPHDPKSNKGGFEALLAAARTDVQRAVPKPTDFSSGLSERERERAKRRWLASAAIVLPLGVWAASVLWHPIVRNLCAGMSARDVFDMGLVPAVALLASLVLVHRSDLRSQLLVRAFWCSNLLIGAASTLGSPGLMPLVFPAAAIGCGAALLLLGDRGLEAAGYVDRFRPLAAREALLTALWIGVALAQTLIAVSHANMWSHKGPIVLAAVVVVAAAGLFRLRRWGLWASAAAALAVVVMTATGRLTGFPAPLAASLAALAGVQFVLLVSMASRSRESFLARTDVRRALGLAGRGALLLSVATAVTATIVKPDPQRQAQYCAAQAFQP